MSGFQNLTEQYWHNVGFDNFDGEQGVALVMGPATKMWALDFDTKPAGPEPSVKHGGSALFKSFWEQFGEQIGRTPVQRSGSGGVHVVLQWDQRCAAIRQWNGLGGGALDIKTNGGFIVAEPTVHGKTGEHYAWLPGYSPADCAPAVTPDAVIEWVLQLHAQPKQARKRSREAAQLSVGEHAGEDLAPEEWADLAREDMAPAGREHEWRRTVAVYEAFSKAFAAASVGDLVFHGRALHQQWPTEAVRMLFARFV